MRNTTIPTNSYQSYGGQQPPRFNSTVNPSYQNRETEPMVPVQNRSTVPASNPLQGLFMNQGMSQNNQRQSSQRNNQGEDIFRSIFNKQALEQQLERFRFPDPHIRYKIMPAEEDKMALDVTTIDDGKDLVKGNMIIWEYHGGPNQQFYFKRLQNQNNKFYIINAATGFSLEIPNSQTKNEAQLVSNPRNNTPNEVFEVTACGKGIYSIKTFCGKCLDIKNHFLRNGNPVIQYDWQNSKNQKWKIWPG